MFHIDNILLRFKYTLGTFSVLFYYNTFKIVIMMPDHRWIIL